MSLPITFWTLILVLLCVFLFAMLCAELVVRPVRTYPQVKRGLNYSVAELNDFRKSGKRLKTAEHFQKRHIGSRIKDQMVE